ncbi:MAG: hypothetical protein WA238_05230 [Methylocella sp.]
MAHARGEQSEKFSPFILAPAELATDAMKRLEVLTKAQAEQFRERNRQCLDRAQAEANLASEFVLKLAAARSIPGAVKAYQEWGSRRLEMVAEDTEHLMNDTQKFIQMSAQLLATGWQSKAPRAGN